MVLTKKVYSLKIAGPAGAGIKSSGLLLSKLLIESGYHIRDYSEYPSLVRGGHNTYQVSFSPSPLFAAHRQIDILVSLDKNHWQTHESECRHGLIIGEDAPLNLPLTEICQPLGSSIYRNTVSLGLIAYLIGLDLSRARKVIKNTFGPESPNNAAFVLGIEYAKKHFLRYQLPVQKSRKISSQIIVDGNEAYGWGFIKGKGNFYSSYPMTPSSGALHFLANKQKQFQFQVIHPEDEIAAASLAVGAAFAGARSATGTSGGGFALMVETVSFCGAADLGVVFYLVSRPGPATGLPTWTSQGDLLFAVHSGHGEFNKIVLAPGDQEESFEMSAQALNLAAKFNVPVIVLSDKFISESSASLFDLSKRSYLIVQNSKPIPGQVGRQYMANSYEHDPEGFSIEDAPSVIKSVKDRLKKAKQILRFLPKPYLHDPHDSDTLIISWGSPKSTILEAFNLLGSPNLAFMQIKSLWPLNPGIKETINKYKKVIVFENNATSQLVSLLKSQFDFSPDATFSKYDGRPFFPEEIIELLSKLHL